MYLYLKNYIHFLKLIERYSVVNKYYIVAALFILLFISIYIHIDLPKKNESRDEKNAIFNNFNKTRHKKNNKFIKFNSYNIHMNNIEKFYSNKIFFLLPSNKCPKTYFFKPKYPKTKSKYIQFQNKNIALMSTQYNPTFFSEKINSIRSVFLQKMGFELNTKMNFADIYLMPYSINKKLENELNHFVVGKYQKINMFYNYKEYISKSLLYYNYKLFKTKFPSEFDYMFEAYSYPEDKKIIEKKFSNYTLKNNKELWLVKPKLGSLGGHIKIFTNLSDIKINDYIITKYLYKPNLIRHKKYDIRFHGLVSTIKPLKLYLYNEGFLRLASENYNFSLSNMNNKFVYLTNIYINSKNKKKYIYK